MYRIALDAMGGDAAPAAPVEGALSTVGASDRPDCEILLVGDPASLEDLLERHPGRRDRIRIVPARERIEAGEAPALAVRRKRDSSIVVGLELQREGEADAFISAGSTGAVVAASVLSLGALPGVDRPAVGAVFPTSRSPTLVLDVGANVNSKPRHLHQFAHLGSVYARDVLGVRSPRVGLLNVGEEEAKGDELAASVHDLLRGDSGLDFVGNVEGNRIMEGACDVLVCGGFVGNVLLKFYESMAGLIADLLRQVGDPSSGDLDLERVLRVLDYTEYGGAPLLGVDGVVIICHGSSPPRAIGNAIRVAVDSLESGMVEDLSRELGGLESPGRSAG